MELPKVVLVLCLYIVIKSSALPTTINGTDQSQNAIKKADQDTVQKTTVDNTVKLQDDFPQQDYVSQDVKKSTTSKKRCSSKHGTNGKNTDKNMNNHMKCDNNNGHKSSNCQNKKQKCQKGEAGNCGSNHGEGSGQGGNEKTESSGYESDKSKYEKGDKPHKEQSKSDGNKTGGNEGQKEETIPEKMIDSWKNVKQQILKKN